MALSKSIALQNHMNMWDNQSKIETIKNIYAKQLNHDEFMTFVELGRNTGLNPFLREIWAVKYKKDDAAQIFIGRDGYRKSAQCHREYEYHLCDAVYSNDEFGVNTGEVLHRYGLKDRGQLLGAYCIAKRKSSQKPFYVFVDAKEYLKPFGVWKDKPATMMKKVAEAQALRGAFQELFGGTYSDAEAWDERQVNPVVEKKPVIIEAIQVKPVELDTDEIILSVERAEDMPALESIFLNAKSKIYAAKDNSALKRLVEAKDKRKAQLTYQDNQEWIDDYNQETGEVK